MTRHFHFTPAIGIFENIQKIYSMFDQCISQPNYASALNFALMNKGNRGP